MITAEEERRPKTQTTIPRVNEVDVNIGIDARLLIIALQEEVFPVSNFSMESERGACVTGFAIRSGKGSWITNPVREIQDPYAKKSILHHIPSSQ